MSTSHSKQPTRVVVLGAGFGGVYVSKRLHEIFHDDREVEIVLINRHNYFLFTPLLHEVATGGVAPQNIVEPLRRLLRVCGGQLHVADVVKVAVEDRYVETTAGLVPFDYLVIALGGRTDFFDVPGAEQNCFALKSLQDAVRLKNHFIETFERASKIDDDTELDKMLNFTVVGGGPTGVEMAAEMAEFFEQTFARLYGASGFFSRVKITLLQRPAELLPQFPAHIRRKSLAVLRAKGIDVRLGASVAGVTRDYVELSTGDRIPTATTIWVAGVRPETIPLDCQPVCDSRGRLVVKNTLQLQEHSRVFALGDVAACSNGKQNAALPASAQVATRQAAAVAENIRALCRGRKLRSFRYKHSGDLVSLGHWSALGDFRGIKISGHLGWWLWRTVYLSKLISWQKRVKVAIDWTLSLFSPRDVSRLSGYVPVDSPPEGIAMEGDGFSREIALVRRSGLSMDTDGARLCDRYVSKKAANRNPGPGLAHTCADCDLRFDCPQAS